MPQEARRVTIVDVARASRVSVSSASVALRGETGVSDDTRARVLAQAEKLGYRPDPRARLLRQRRSQLLGVTFAIGQPFHAELLESLYRAAAGTPFELVLSATTEDRSIVDACEALAADRCEALILISPELDPASLARLGTRLPVVAISPGIPDPGVDVVRSDDEQGITTAVEHLVARGHREIVYVDGGPGAVSSLRRNAYLAAVTGHGLRPRVVTGRPTEEAGIDAAQALLRAGDLPTAVLAHNDLAAVGLLLTLRAHQIEVPGQVAIVGYDDSRTARLSTIRLTTISQAPEDIARVAVHLATTKIDDPGRVPHEAVTPPRLVVRATTGG